MQITDLPKSGQAHGCRGSAAQSLPTVELGRAEMSSAQADALEPIEKASIDELRSLQLERLKKSLSHTFRNVKSFREKCQKAGVHPDDLKCLDDLASFPFTTKQDFREHYPFGMFAVPIDQIVRIHASSGTTGKPAVVGYTANDMDTWSGVVARSLRAAGALGRGREHGFGWRAGVDRGDGAS